MPRDAKILSKVKAAANDFLDEIFCYATVPFSDLIYPEELALLAAEFVESDKYPFINLDEEA